MSLQLQWTLSAQITNGPKVTQSQSVDVGAYDEIAVVVPAKSGSTTSKLTVEVQPGGDGQVQFLLISAVSAAAPGSPGPGLAYSINTEQSDASKRIRLDAAVFLIGGALQLLGAAPNKIVFYSDSAADTNVQILVGRKAVAP